MKSYKLVNSKEVQEKAFRLGYEWCESGKIITWVSNPFLFLYESGIITTDLKLKAFLEKDFPEITQADFLALPEPLIVGDWVKFENDKGVYLFQIAEVNSDWVKPTKVISDLYAFPHDGHYIDYCTKLTQQQIDILELPE